MFNNPGFTGQNDFTQNFTGDNNEINMDIEVSMSNNQTGIMNGQPMMGTVSGPIMEPVQERVVNRTFVHEVPHVCPIRTRIVNHHVYRHTYRPEYSCCEENVVSNVNEGSCCNFR